MSTSMDLYPLILESTDLQQTSEINSTKNVKASDVNFPLIFQGQRSRSIRGYRSILVDILFTFPGNYCVGEENTINKSVSISL
jgi:hypothetical protein